MTWSLIRRKKLFCPGSLMMLLDGDDVEIDLDLCMMMVSAPDVMGWRPWSSMARGLVLIAPPTSVDWS